MGILKMNKTFEELEAMTKDELIAHIFLMRQDLGELKNSIKEVASMSEDISSRLKNLVGDPRDEELEALLTRHKHEIAKLKLESDRRARRVAERMLARCQAEVIGYPYISDTQMSGLRWMMDGINIEALVDESKL